MTIIGIVYYRVDTIFIEAFLGLSFVGFYSASYKIMETFKIVPDILRNVDTRIKNTMR